MSFKKIKKISRTNYIIVQSAKEENQDEIEEEEIRKLDEIFEVDKPSPGIIHPDNLIKAFWDIIGLVFVLYQSIFAPYRICFNDMANGGIAVFEMIQDFFFMIDILASFNTGIYKNGSIVMQRKEITMTYLKSWFCIDFVASFPYPIVISYEDYFNISESSKNELTDQVKYINL